MAHQKRPKLLSGRLESGAVYYHYRKPLTSKPSKNDGDDIPPSRSARIRRKLVPRPKDRAHR